MKYFICAGEASGDLHASYLIAAIKREDPTAEIVFLGGEMMAEVAGHKPLIHYKDMAFMGFVDVVRHLGAVRHNLSVALGAIDAGRPDAVILVDYPSFNLRLAAHAHKHGIPVYYYISPKVWAWKEGRVKKIRKYVRRMYSILPFEVDFYSRRHGYKVDYVGNPSAEEVEMKRASLPSRVEFARLHGLDPEKPIMALVPGSRVSEIKNNLAIMAEVAARHKDFQAVIAGAPNVSDQLYSQITVLPVVHGATFELVGVADVALVTSGTATLEAALLETPQVVCFRHGGSRLVYNMYKKLLKIPYVSLPNLIAGEAIVPELLMHLCTVDSVDGELCKILPGEEGRAQMLSGYKRMKTALGTTPAAPTAAHLLVEDLKKISKK
ncbi:MAG: lipid-A-disaccharide synthase [Bacteroidales bacterium]|nr:lipid-A-disaccharide synthase [Bacteroidales bacterium]